MVLENCLIDDGHHHQECRSGKSQGKKISLIPEMLTIFNTCNYKFTLLVCKTRDENGIYNTWYHDAIGKLDEIETRMIKSNAMYSLIK